MRASCTPTGSTLLISVSPHKDEVLTPLKSVDDAAGASDRGDGKLGAIEDEDQEEGTIRRSRAVVPESSGTSRRQRPQR